MDFCDIYALAKYALAKKFNKKYCKVKITMFYLNYYKTNQLTLKIPVFCKLNHEKYAHN